MSWVVGVGLSIVGNVIINLGTNIVKIAHERRKTLRAERAQSGGPKPSATDLIKDKYWAGGTFLFVCGNLLNFASFGFAAQTLLASLSSIQFVTNIFFARTFFNEKISRRISLATLCIILGNTLVVVFTSQSVTNESITADTLADNFTQAGFLVYLCLIFVISACIQAYFQFHVLPRLRKHLQLQIRDCEERIYKQHLKEKAQHNEALVGEVKMGQRCSVVSSNPRQQEAEESPQSSTSNCSIVNEKELMNSPTRDISLDLEMKENLNKHVLDRINSGNEEKDEKDDIIRGEYKVTKISFTTLVSRTAGWSNKSITRRIDRASEEDKAQLLSLREIRLLPVFYAGQSAVLGSLSVLLAKALSSLFKTTFSGDNQLNTGAFWIVIGCWFVAMAFWLTRMNKALKMFDGVIIIPTLQVFWIVFSILSGGIFYQELKQFSGGNLVGFAFSVLLILLGVVALTTRTKKRKPEEKEEVVALHDIVEKLKSETEERPEGSILSLKGLEKQMERDEMSLIRKVSLVPHWECELSEDDKSADAEDPSSSAAPPSQGIPSEKLDLEIPIAKMSESAESEPLPPA